MTDQENVTLGEIARAVTRIEHRQTAIAEKVDEMAGPIAVLRNEMNDLKPKVDKMWRDAAFIAGVVAGIGFIVNHFWK